MPRSKNKKPQISLYLLFTIIAFLIITPIYLSQKYESKRTSPVGFKQEQIQDEAKDGVYTNYTYGFRFKYPEGKFSENENGQLVYEYGNERLLFLNATIHNKGPYSYRDNFEKVYKASINETVQLRNQNATKLYSEDKGQYRFVVDFMKTPEDAEIEHSVGYRASWLMPNDRTITLTMFGDPSSESYVIDNKPIFDNIVNSFEFINQ